MIDSSLNLQAGDIFTWENYPLYIHEKKDRRWLLFLGYRALEAIVYQVTTTTQYQHYEGSGNRKGNNFFKINKGIGGLAVDSIIDLAFFEDVPEKIINDYKADIAKKGSLDQNWINKLVKHIKLDTHISGMVKKDIYGYLRDAHFKVTV